MFLINYYLAKLYSISYLKHEKHTMGDLNADFDLHRIHNFTQRITNGDELNMFYSYTFLSRKILQKNTKLIHLGQYKQHRNEPKLLNGDLNARF